LTSKGSLPILCLRFFLENKKHGYAQRPIIFGRSRFKEFVFKFEERRRRLRLLACVFACVFG
jgi:hypothetical protein